MRLSSLRTGAALAQITWSLTCRGVGGHTRRRSAGHGGGGGYAKRRCGRGAGREGLGAYPVGAVETGVTENEEVEYDSNEYSMLTLPFRLSLVTAAPSQAVHCPSRQYLFTPC